MATLFGLLLSLLGQDVEHTKDSLDAVKAALAKKEAVLVDVREPSEWNAGHLESARLVPLSLLKEESKQDKLSENVTGKLPEKSIVYLHCRSGSRVLNAAAILKKYGYDVRPLKEGFEDLKAAGFPEAKK